MTRFYRVPLVDGAFQGVDYTTIVEGIAYARHVEQGFGYIETEAYYPFEEITAEQFASERLG